MNGSPLVAAHAGKTVLLLPVNEMNDAFLIDAGADDPVKGMT